ncbi:GH36-type glycosyl hydrolase domain-containing protein [Tahibacter soli]|uniref:Glucoamylase family protein n=1 Tax=Tahibacter soli TaxID=2983605 RepID=A0A9X4BKF9_9GAMM|nr:glucoamylase family protein [Tahibacter soli]MDC8016091.1 glucoamylase family protein [Tahibacter soli]
MTALFDRLTLRLRKLIAAPEAALLDPIRSPTFDAERFHTHGVSLARKAREGEDAQTPLRWNFYPRVRSNIGTLRHAYRWMVRQSRRGGALGQDAQWILDNFHLIDEQVKSIPQDLPPGYYRRLPKLASGPFAGFPRVFEIAWAFVAHSDSHFQGDMLTRFLEGYQSETPLEIGELWALPTSIRAVLLENLRRLVERLIGVQAARDYADALYERLKGGQGLAGFSAALHDFRSKLLRDAFLAQFVQRLRATQAADGDLTPGLIESGIDPDAELHAALLEEQTRMATSQLIAANTVRSMKDIARFDWSEFVEAHSDLHARLSRAPGYLQSDFRTRDAWRQSIENLARRARRSEPEVADHAVRLTLNAADEPVADLRCANLGNVLEGAARADLETAVFGAPRHWRRRLRDAASAMYLGSLWTATAALAGGTGAWIAQGRGPWLAAALALVAAPPALRLVQTALNRIVAQIRPPRRLPRASIEGEIPLACKTLVAVPTLLLDRRHAEALANQLELHYLANPEPHARFALLTDFPDAQSPELPGERRLLGDLAALVGALNARYGACDDGEARFLLLHRRRRWCETQGCWMGWERKRGKLEELNKALLSESGMFVALDGGLSAIPTGVRYVLTLDADSRLPPRALKRLVATAAHPLNAAVLDAEARRVVAGYAVFQPRITISLPTPEHATAYRRLNAGATGIDPYAGLASDPYQDIASSGTFWGKGLYDVRAFSRAVDWRVQPGTLLSHDLVEGALARCAYVSDVELIEDFPSHSEVDAQRHHRWMRGDWQLLPMIAGPNALELPPVERWKAFDNLLRSLAAPGAVALLVTGWLLGAGAALAATTFVVAAFAAFAFIDAVPAPAASPTRRAWLPLVRTAAVHAAEHLGAALWRLSRLAREATLSLDAIARTLARLARRRNLLEWATAEQTERRARHDPAYFVASHRYALIVVAALAALVVFVPGAAWRFALPWLVAWSVAPFAAWLASRAPRAGANAATPAERAALRRVARRTWLWFDRHVDATQNHLPPDNVQIDPRPIVATRTSPTNIGMYLLAAACAQRFGWIGAGELVDRLAATLATIESLPKYRGHLYNWYETRTLAILPPGYVSSVDSGNLAAHLFAVAHACRSLRATPLFAAGCDDCEDQRALLGDTVCRLPADCSELAAALQRLDRPCAAGWLGDAGAELARETAQARAALARAQSLPKYADGHDAFALAGEYLRLFESRGADWARFVAPLHDAARACAAHPALEAASRAALAAQDGVPMHALVARYDALANAIDTAGAGAFETARTPLAFGRAALVAVLDAADACADTAHRLALAMDFSFLYDRDAQLFSIGYRADDNALDEGRYDLLASEARLTSYFAIAKGDVPLKHWFRLGRNVLPSGGEGVLRSWAGSMFEYLMPSLVLDTPGGSLLEQSCRRAVVEQRRYARRLRLPWGVSESGYNARDRELTFQYLSFGIPALAIKRSVEHDLVVAPYATGLAAMVDPSAAVANFAALEKIGALAPGGFYEAVDFTPERVPENATYALVRSHMAHHQGMLLVALCAATCDRAPQRWFHADPAIRALEPLLHERAVDAVPPRSVDARQASEAAPDAVAPLEPRRYTGSRDALGPITHLLSNGRMFSLVTAAGSGGLRWRQLALTRWRDDATRDDYGCYLYLRTRDGALQSATPQPCGRGRGVVEFFEDRARFVRRHGALETRVEVFVSPEDDVELRRVRLANRGDEPLRLDLTTYAEIVLAPPAADEAHPAFSNLFVATIADPDLRALLFRRRSRAPGEESPWLAHFAIGDDGEFDYETDRMAFVGREHTVHRPAACVGQARLGRGAGRVLDPIAALRVSIALAPGESIERSFAFAVAPDRDAIADIIAKYRFPEVIERASQLSWTYSQVQLRQLALGPRRANVLQNLARRLVYTFARGDERLRPQLVERDHLWRFGISGERPLILVQLVTDAGLDLVRELARAREYWRYKGLGVDIAVLHNEPPSYHQPLHRMLESYALTPSGDTAAVASDLFVIHAHRLDSQCLASLKRCARVTIAADGKSLRELFGTLAAIPETPRTARRAPRVPAVEDTRERAPLAHNGLGGFTADGREYRIDLPPGGTTPLPWINVIAQRGFGCQVSAAGAGFSWSQNSRERQLTPWSNDPVCDTPGEAIWLRDVATDELWSPTPLPHRHPAALYTTRHGYGYSVFECTTPTLASTLTVFVERDATARHAVLSLTNRSAVPRRVDATFYAQWRLGAQRSAAAFVATDYDDALATAFATNELGDEFAGRVAYATLDPPPHAWTCDRAAFLGAHGQLRRPAALKAQATLSARAGRGLDACVALQRHIALAPGATTEVRFTLGDADSRSAARAAVAPRGPGFAREALAAVRAQWEELTGALRVTTPEPSLDLMLNGRLLHQVIACRLWSRAAFYQLGGAYGFRDQLQDVLALVQVQPSLAREQLLRAAARQFREGDVQHWWHPPSGRGVRTRISDDLLWLPFVAARYVAATNDAAVLDAETPFLDGEMLPPGVEDRYFTPIESADWGTLYEHCRRAIDARLDVGEHGLPPIGSGDWNDGMNRVGLHGAGESVWMGWFLIGVIDAFAPLAEERGDGESAQRWRAHRTKLAQALDAHAWDGAWYRRAYFDDGTPLGSAANDECRIDLIAQAWAVLSGAAPARAAQALASADAHLVDREAKLVRLLAPPFEHAEPHPGYIRGYPPGVRENGGQYTHAAMWHAIAHARLGHGDEALRMLQCANPIARSGDAKGAARYRIEPYAVAGDIYAVEPHTGRGGWSWYTGAAAWFYVAAIEEILGLRVRHGRLHIDPCVPAAWRGYSAEYRWRDAVYRIAVANRDGVCKGVRELRLDGRSIDAAAGVPLVDAGAHDVEVDLGAVDLGAAAARAANG